MRGLKQALILCAVQLALVATIALKYLHERKVCPRVWVQVTQYDPEAVMRGRYLELQPIVNVCGLDKGLAQHHPAQTHGSYTTPEEWSWMVKLVPQNGTLVPVAYSIRNFARNDDSMDREEPLERLQPLFLRGDAPCDAVQVLSSIDLYIPESGKTPFPLPLDTQAWLETTIPPKGPLRAIQLSTKKDGVLTPLNLN